MRKDSKKIVLIIAFGIGVISFNAVKEEINHEYFKCIKFMSSHSSVSATY